MPQPNSQFAYAAPQDNDSLAWKQLEEAQRRRSQLLQAERAASPDAAATTVSAAPADGSVDATLAAVKSRTTSSGPPGERSGQASMRLASNDASQPVVTPAPPASAFPVEALDRDRLVTAMQTELGRIGCYADEADGKWDKETRDALRRFARQAKFPSIPTDPTAALLDDLKSRPEHFCPLECGSGQRAEGDQCVAVARPEPVERKAAKPRAVVQERRAPAEPRPVVARPRPQSAPPQAPVSTAVSAPRQVPRAVMGVGF